MKPTIFIIGKGPSLKGTIQCNQPNTIYAALNTAIKLCEGRVDYHFMNDFEAKKTLTKEDMIKSDNLIIPTYPHVQEKMDPWSCYNVFLRQLPEPYKGAIHLYQLPTAEIRIANILSLDVKYSVAETATLYFTHLGYKRFRYIGVGTAPGYTNLLNENPTQTQTSAWLINNFNRIVEILKENACEYEFQ